MTNERPVHIDIERMERALAGPRYTVPQGLTAEQFIAFMDVVSKVVNDAADQVRAAVLQERENAALKCELSPSEIRLMAGELTLQEMRSVLAVLQGCAAAIRSGK